MGQRSARYSRSVLLVDDDLDTRGMYGLALELQGYRVLDAPNASDALSRALELRPDVIVTDLGLPGPGDGVEFVRALRNHPRTAQIPVLAVTGRDPRGLGEAATLFEAVLLKPVTPDSLLLRIRESLRSSASASDEEIR